MISEEPDTATKPRTVDGRGGGFSALLRRVLLGVGLVLYTLLFAEGFVRVFDPQPLMPRYISGTDWGVRGNIPHARYWHHTPEIDVQYRQISGFSRFRGLCPGTSWLRRRASSRYASGG